MTPRVEHATRGRSTVRPATISVGSLSVGAARFIMALRDLASSSPDPEPIEGNMKLSAVQKRAVVAAKPGYQILSTGDRLAVVRRQSKDAWVGQVIRRARAIAMTGGSDLSPTAADFDVRFCAQVTAESKDRLLSLLALQPTANSCEQVRVSVR